MAGETEQRGAIATWTPQWPVHQPGDVSALAVETGGADVSVPDGWVKDEEASDGTLLVARRPEDPCLRCGALVRDHDTFGGCP